MRYNLKAHKSPNKLIDITFNKVDCILRLGSKNDKRSLTTSLIIAGFNTVGLIDCGATANFIDEAFVKQLFLEPLTAVAPRVEDVNGNFISPERKNAYFKIGIRIQNKKLQYHTFSAVPMKNEKIILGMSWLQTTNPVIDWRSTTLKLSDNIQVLEADEFINDAKEEAIYAYYTDAAPNPTVPLAY